MAEACTSCTDEARERNRDLDSLRINAQKQASEQKTSKAICKDEATGLFIADAGTAIREHFNIIEVISRLQ